MKGRKASKISKEEVKHLASLARIQMTKGEEAVLSEQLSRILDYFKKIDEADVTNIEPTYHVLELTNVARRDEPRIFDTDQLLKVVPQTKGRYVKVPKMV